MIFKVYYQEVLLEAPVREKTKTVYVEAECEREVRAKLLPFNYNIELVQALTGAHLEFEKQSENFKVLELV